MNFYRINFSYYGEYYAWGKTATQAVADARYDIFSEQIRVGINPTPLGTAAVRKALYGEWECNTVHYAITGAHLTH